MITDYQQNPSTGASLVSGTETVVISNVVDSGAGGNFPQGRVIHGYVNVLSGATGGAYTLKVRQGTTTAGTQVGTSDTITLPATTNMSIPFSKQDNSAAGAGSYCVTLTAAGSNGTMEDGCLEIEVPDPYGTED
jgi:hypothetical protein